MAIEDQAAYRGLADEIDKSRGLGSNLLVITVPGTGMGKFLGHYVERNQTLGVAMLDSPDGQMAPYNIVNLDWAKVNVAEIVESCFKRMSDGQRMMVSVNYPEQLRSPEVMSSVWLNHTYRKYYFGARNEQDTNVMALELNPDLTGEELKQIYKLSGGVAQIVKYLVVNGTDHRDGVEIVLEPLIKAVTSLDTEVCEKLNLMNGGAFLGELLAERLRDRVELVDIRIDFDLSFSEDGVRAGELLTAMESEILRKMLANGNKITKEEVSDVKWGEGKYEEFSDQAINKAMRRLDGKLSKYTVSTIPKIGFILKKR